jgi:hypothetical protein
LAVRRSPTALPAVGRAAAVLVAAELADRPVRPGPRELPAALLGLLVDTAFDLGTALEALRQGRPVLRRFAYQRPGEFVPRVPGPS